MHSKKRESLTLTNFLNFPKQKPNSWLQRQALEQPDQPAFYTKDVCLTFSELNHYVQQLAYYFKRFISNQQKTIKRVAILSDNQTMMYQSILALWELGMEIQFLNTRLTSEELAYQLKDANTRLLITEHPEHFSFENVTIISFPKKKELIGRINEPPIDFGYQLEQIASIMYTSGTTGKPKGVPQTFSNHQASSLATQKSMAIESGENWLCCVPLYHISGLSILLRSLVLGISVHLCEKFHPSEVNQLILSEKTAYLSLVTKMLKDLLPFVPEDGYPSSLKQVLLGGGPIESTLLEDCCQLKLPVMLSYGMTETCSQVVAGKINLHSKFKDTVGRPLMGVQIKIDGTNQANESGEILLKGPSIVKGYLNGRDRHSWTKEGWFCTGDWGYLTDTGELKILSRMSERIISGGENIYPAEIEAIFLKSQKIAEAIVIGRADPNWGQRPVAYLKLIDKVSVNEICNLMEQLASYKHPDEIFVIHDLPKTASGKPLKRLFLTEERVNYIDYQLI